MAVESRFTSYMYSCFVSVFLTNWLDFTKTIIPRARMASESIAHEAERAIDSEPIQARGIIFKYCVRKQQIDNQVYKWADNNHAT